MPSKDKPTKEEHFVPRIYFKGFSDNEKSFFGYNLKSNKQIPDCSIETACKRKQLYEFRNNDDQIVAENFLEETLAKTESLFKKHRDGLIGKAKYLENLNTKCFFSSQEKAFWKTYIVIQMLRTPVVINYISERVNEETDNKFTLNQIRNYTLISALPIIKELRIDNNSIFHYLLSLIAKDSMCAFIDENDSIFTSDNPVACSTPKSIDSDIDLLFFPLTPHIALILFGGELKKEFPKNQLCKFSHQQLYRFKFEIAHTAQNMIYSKKALSTKDIKLINDARRYI